MLNSDNQALRYINGQHKLNAWHAKWVSFLQEFTFVVQHKFGVQNKVANALGKKSALLTQMRVQVLGFDDFKGLCQYDHHFGPIWQQLSQNRPMDEYGMQDGYIFKASRLCIPQCSLREGLVKKLHGGGLAGQVGRDKTMALLEEKFYWSSVKQEVSSFISR